MSVSISSLVSILLLTGALVEQPGSSPATPPKRVPVNAGQIPVEPDSAPTAPPANVGHRTEMLDQTRGGASLPPPSASSSSGFRPPGVVNRPSTFTRSGAPAIDSEASEPSAPAETGQANARGGGWSFSGGAGAGAESAVPVPRINRAPIQPEGKYQGVRIGSKVLSPVPDVPDATGAAVVTWVGFQRTQSGGSAVFVQVDRDVEYRLVTLPQKVELELIGTKVNVKNHARRLDLRYFPQTPVNVVQTRQKKDLTTIRITLRSVAVPELRVQEGPEGHRIIVLEFGGEATMSNASTPSATTN